MAKKDVMPAGGRPRSLWFNRDYLLLWGGQLVSVTGNGVFEIAFPLLILTLTHSSLEAGIAGALIILPEATLGIFAGVLVDRWDRKKIMIICDICRCINVASIVLIGLTSHLTILQLYLNALLEGCFVTFFFLAQKACLRNVVPREQLAMALAQEELSEGITVSSSPFLGGILFALSSSLPFLADAVSYLVSVFTLSLIKTPFQQKKTQQKRHVLQELKEGFQWLFHQPIVRNMTLFYSSVALISRGFTLTLIVLLQGEGANPAVVGLIFTIGGFGSLLGALIGPFVQRRCSFGQAMLGVRWLVALLWFGFAFAPNPLWVAVVFFFYLFVEPTEDVVYFRYRAILLPDDMQGRVISVGRLFSRTASTCAPIIAGWLLGAIGALPTVYVYGVYLCIVTGMLTLSRHIRNAPPIEMPEPGAV